MKKILFFVLSIVIVLALILFYYQNQNKQLILIVLDGINVEQFNKLLSDNKLPNFQKIISNGGINTYATITGHQITETAPGNAELHTGLKSDQTKVSKNGCNQILPEGTTAFERLKNFNSQIINASIYDKGNCYLPLPFLQNAKDDISWWQDKTTFAQKNYKDTACIDSTNTANKTSEFLKSNKDKSFYLFVYLSIPDCMGHQFGVPSTQYDEAIINIDNSLGILLNELQNFQKNPKIIISGDHGWTLNSKGHSENSDQTNKIILISNDSNLINKEANKSQCDIAPTILNYFGLNPNQYSDISNSGCKVLGK
jgi:predicted AlkP superfamily pyrophosphatase or phosphodiesterase